MNTKRCCILFNQPRDNASDDELDVLDQVEFIEKNLNLLDIETSRMGITNDFMNELARLASDKPDFVFNLVESINNKGELCYFIPALLNMYSIPYSGNPLEALFITTSKVLTKQTLNKAGIKNPQGYSPSECDRLIPGKRYILKPVWEDGSLGITGDSVFTYQPGYENRLKKNNDTHWLIEEYVEGREFNISMIYSEKGPEVLPPAEIIFQNYSEDKPRIVDFKAKWEKGSFEYENTIRDFPVDDLAPALRERIISVSLQCWKEFRLKGYARVDMRVDSNDNPYVIEVNANPCLSPDGGFVAAIIATEIPFTDALKKIIADLNR
jgi:D-alanine-D-alanine ligase